MKKIIIWLLIIGVVAGSGVYLYLFYFGAKHKDPLKSASMVTVSATALYDLYANQEDSANALYLGKVIKVNGKIAGIDLKESRYSIYYETNGEMGTVLCEMDSTENSKVKVLKVGDPVSIAGFCNGINMDVYLDRCKLAE
jgi:tRNA_anti-like